MKKTIFSVVILLLVGTHFFSSSAQVRLVRHHRPVSRILVTSHNASDSTAAVLLQDFVERSTEARLPILTADPAIRLRKGDVLIGNEGPNAKIPVAGLKEDGYLISTEDGYLRILSGGDGGSVYGVVALLEKYVGVNYWGENEYDLDQKEDLEIPLVRESESPAFIHRQTHFYGLSDPYYKMFARFEWVDELFAGRYWVHTFHRLVPVAKYGKEHPEYYAYIHGARRPKDNSQLCLSNPEVLEIITHQLDSIFKAHPERDMISVSQNDGNDSWCRCEACQKIIDEEGSVSGPYIRFMNELAKRFPDKQISTLSYLFTVEPPQKVKPLPNVNIMLCNINCTRELPLDQNASGQRFMRSLEKWSSMTNNIFLWDYGINFHNYLAPFPNFHVLGENMKLFRKNHVNIYFHQLSSTRGESWAELRTWLVSKLMWNPEANVDELVRTFLKGYYGASSAPYLYQYIKLMEGALMASNQVLWIYDTPVTFKNGMLNAPLRQRYNQLFDQAEKAAEGDSLRLARIHRSRLELIFADLEIEKTCPDYDVNALGQKLDQFEQWCHEFQVTRLTEPGLMTEDYIRFYRDRYLRPRPKSLALHAPVEFLIPAHSRYNAIAPTVLTDGLLGANTFNNSWLGWEGTDGSFILDLGVSKEISEMELDGLLAYNDWIWPIKSVSFSVSSDKVDFQNVGHTVVDREKVTAPYYQVGCRLDKTVSARYIRIDVEGQKFMPGSGNRCWFFIDEVRVY